MMTLTILNADKVAPDALPMMLEEVNAQSALQYLIADWWNAPGIFTNCALGLAELRKRGGDCVGGSAFGATTEICWRLVGDKFRVALIAEQDLSALRKTADAKWEADSQEIDKEIKRLKQSQDDDIFNASPEFDIILWGTECIGEPSADTSIWIETRIPRPLNYPVGPKPPEKEEQDKSDSVLLKVKAYYDVRGRPVIYRRYGLYAKLTGGGNKNQQEKQALAKEPEAPEAATEEALNA